MSRIPQSSRLPQTSRTSQAISSRSNIPAGGRRVERQESRVPVPPSGGVKGQVGRVIPVGNAPAGPSLLQKRVFKEAVSKSGLEPGKKVQAYGTQHGKVPRGQVPRLTRMTKRGEEPLLQEVTMETTVQRNPAGEYIAKTIRGTDIDPQGNVQQIEITCQQIDPTHGTESVGVNQTISTVSNISVTSGGKQTKKNIKKRTIKAPRLLEKPNVNPHHVKRLVKEETEDVETSSKWVPPELVSASVEKFPLRKRLFNLRLNPEPLSILTQSVAPPRPTADEAITEESPPEALFSVIHAAEKGATPGVAPNQVFNSLFPDVKESHIAVSAIAPGPLEDIVVPTGQAKKMTAEVLTEDMDKAVLECQINQELPKDCICTELNIVPQSRTPKGEKKIPMMLEEEIPPWEDATIQKMAVLVGGNPVHLLDASDIADMEESQEIVDELSKGIDFFVDADTVPFETKIQLRGSKLPDWFPGYMTAFPHLPEVVHVAKSPSGVLHTAWKTVKPKFFSLDNVIFNEPALN